MLPTKWVVELAQLHRAESRFDRQLRRALSRMEADCLDLSKSGRQQSRCKKDGKEAADALV